jgi:hypothetical protein
MTVLSIKNEMRNLRSISSCATRCCAVYARGSAAAATAAMAGVIAIDKRVRNIEIALGMRTAGSGGTLGSSAGGDNPTAPALQSTSVTPGAIRMYPPSMTASGSVFCKADGQDNYEIPCSAPLAKYLYYDIGDADTPQLIKDIFAAEMAKTVRVIVENEDYFVLDIGGEPHTMFRVLGDYERSSVYFTDTKQQYTMSVDKPVEFALFVNSKPDPEDTSTWTHYGYALCGVAADDTVPFGSSDVVDPDTLG